MDQNCIGKGGACRLKAEEVFLLAVFAMRNVDDEIGKAEPMAIRPPAIAYRGIALRVEQCPEHFVQHEVVRHVRNRGDTLVEERKKLLAEECLKVGVADVVDCVSVDMPKR